MQTKITTTKSTLAAFILFSTLWSGSVLAEKPAAPARLAAMGPEAGVNIISAYNNYSDPQLQDEPLNHLFAALQERGLKRISLRVTWATMERQEASLDPKILAAMKRIFGTAQKYGFKAMLDFHTLFMEDNYSCPKWVARYSQDDGSPGVRSMIMIARSRPVRERYLAFVAGVVSEMKECPAIDAVSVMNEPFSPDWRKPAYWNADLYRIQGVIEAAACSVREKAPGRRVAVRFCGGFNPWSENPGRRFDALRMLKALDIIGQNIYLDPRDDNAADLAKPTKDLRPTLSWTIMAEAAERCRQAGKSFWITEFGAPWKQSDKSKYQGASLEAQKEYFEGCCKRFWSKSIRPEAVMAWVLESDPKNADPYGLYDGAAGTFRPAFDVYTRYMLKAATARQP